MKFIFEIFVNNLQKAYSLWLNWTYQDTLYMLRPTKLYIKYIDMQVTNTHGANNFDICSCKFP